MYRTKNNKIYDIFNVLLILSLTIPLSSQSPNYSFQQELLLLSSIIKSDQLKNCSSDLNKKPNSTEYLTHFNCGRVSLTTDPLTGNNQVVREFTLIIKENTKVPISYDGHIFNGWTFNGTIPGPTIRVNEGDFVKITVINNEKNKLTHSFHSHSIHPAEMDGVSMGGYKGGLLKPGESFTYEFIAKPYGVFPYHCHVDPIADHINRGLYGMMIIDPINEPRKQMTELVMTMNAYDMDYEQEGPIIIPSMDEISKRNNGNDGSMIIPVSDNSDDNSDNEKKIKDNKENDSNKEKDESEKSLLEIESEGAEEEKERDNEIYTVNGIAFDYIHNPIKLQVGQEYRIYLLNMVEFDLINNFHMHGNMFDYITAGTDEIPDFKTDVVTLSQGDRGIVEFKYDYPGKYMFHAHVTEFTDLGWLGFFDVK